MELIVTHPNADFDAVASMLAAHKLHPDALPLIPDRLNRNVADFLQLYRNGLPFSIYREAEYQPGPVERLIIVDTQRPPNLDGLDTDAPQTIIDHHRPFERDDLRPGDSFLCEPLGSNTALLVEHLRERAIPITSLEATLLALGVYEDTGSLSYGTTTPRDIRAAAWLLEQGSVLDTVRRFLSTPLTPEQQSLLDHLLSASESRVIHGYTITVGAARVDQYIEQVASVAHRLRDILDPAALFIAVQMPENLLLVCRSNGEVVDVGAVARLFGGGGHARAAAATIYDRDADQIVARLWDEIRSRVQPVIQVADLMSFGVQTVAAEVTAAEVTPQMRRIGHEGFPVVDGGRVVGLLTRRQVDRALDHNMGEIPVRDLMTAGEITLRPHDSIMTLEKRMVESGWGQIPVIDDHGALIGIVTRTDLIKHWARIHPARPAEEPTITRADMGAILGDPTLQLIDHIAGQARDHNQTLYMVGGVVRDLLLRRPNYDLDFVVEQDAIALCTQLQARYGGELHTHRPFGTAKWLLDAGTAARLELPLAALPQHIDFATARNEFYEHPTALPTVYQSSIKLDLQRRDFTINTLALQLSPEGAAGRLLDFYGGLADLQAGLIRVLHSLSFVDDPTRIVRAVRFQRRLDFTIEPRTAELIDTALPMLRRISGERVRHEIDLLLAEPDPEGALYSLEARGILEAIHPAFHLPAQLSDYFARSRCALPGWAHQPIDRISLYWHLMAIGIPHRQIAEWGERLLLGRRLTQSMAGAARLAQTGEQWAAAHLRNSQIATLLDDVTETALLAVWLTADDDDIRALIEAYLTDWRHIQPITSGHDLRRRGLAPGPGFGVVLRQLREAWIDGAVTDAEGEAQLLEELLKRSAADDIP